MFYLTLKLIHILSATLVFGGGICLALLGTVVFKSKNLLRINEFGAVILRLELYLTVSAAIALVATGITMANIAGLAFFSAWLSWVWCLLLLVIACWLAGVRLQHLMLNLVHRSLVQQQDLPADYDLYLRRWLFLGLPSTLAMIGIFYLMVFKAV